MAHLSTKAIRLVPRLTIIEQTRFRSKINVTKPRKPHFTRGVFEKFLTRYWEPPRPVIPIWEACENVTKRLNKKTETPPHPYEIIIGRECLNWFKNSKMVAFLHKNSITQEEIFEFALPLKRANMYIKYYGQSIATIGLKDTEYEAVLPLFCAPGLIVFSPEKNVEKLRKILRSTPQLTLMAGILDGTLLNVNDFLKYGKMDITEARVGLVQTLQTAAGGNLCRQLTHHQSTLVSRLDQIADGKNVQKPNDNE